MARPSGTGSRADASSPSVSTKGFDPARGFTPGPWMVEEGLDPNDLPRPWVQQQADPKHYVALACGDDTRNSYENARLIAAAPELYRELEAAWLIFRAYEALHLEKGTEDGAQKARRNAAYAKSIERILAKARGGQ